MRFDEFAQLKVQSAGTSLARKRRIREEAAALKKLTKKLLFGVDCSECCRMAAIPQGAFAVLQVRKNFERSYTSDYQEEEEKKESKNSAFSSKVLQEGRELTPLKYNSKLMNSIWGLYNRYSVHNFKKIDANEQADLLSKAWGVFSPAEVVVAEGPTARIIGPCGGAGH